MNPEMQKVPNKPNIRELSERRKFLKGGALGAGALLLGSRAWGAITQSCGLATPAQTEGPFYPGEGQFHFDNDLTRLPGHAQTALGQVVEISGTIQDILCRPLPGATVEIWQACASGRYNNSKDDNPAPLDPDFKYWGEVQTDNDGKYSFRTIIPGAYPADTDWIRPPHIHFKVTRLGYEDLITQMYFKGNPYNDRDLILRKIPASERDSVIVDFAGGRGVFDIRLKRV